MSNQTTSALALAIANSPLAEVYFGALSTYVGGLSVLHWIKDALGPCSSCWLGWKSNASSLMGSSQHVLEISCVRLRRIGERDTIPQVWRAQLAFRALTLALFGLACH